MIPTEAIASFCVSLQDEGVTQRCRELEKKSDARPAGLPPSGTFLPPMAATGDHFFSTGSRFSGQKCPLPHSGRSAFCRDDIERQFAVAIGEFSGVDFLELDRTAHHAGFPVVMFAIMLELGHHFAREQFEGFA